jgi:hypothetical protein
VRLSSFRSIFSSAAMLSRILGGICGESMSSFVSEMYTCSALGHRRQQVVQQLNTQCFVQDRVQQQLFTDLHRLTRAGERRVPLMRRLTAPPGARYSEGANYG